MSAYLVEAELLAGLVEYAAHHSLTWHAAELVHSMSTEEIESHYRRLGRTATVEELSLLVAMLYAANAESVAYRYDEGDAWLDSPAPEYRRGMAPSGLGALDILDALACFEYQSCEHPGWRQSEAWHFCEALTGEAIRNLPRAGGDEYARPWWHEGGMTESQRAYLAKQASEKLAVARAADPALDTLDFCKYLRTELRRRSGKAWSVRNDRGTAWGWVRVSAPPARCDEFGRMSEADQKELAALLGLSENMAHGGVSIPPGDDFYREFQARARGDEPTEYGVKHWD